MLTIADVSMRLGYNRDYVSRLIRSGKLRAYRMTDGQYRITEEQYAEFLAGMELAAVDRSGSTDVG